MKIMDIVIIIVIILCTYVGEKWSFAYVDGRWQALEDESKRSLKIIVSILIGLVAGYFLFAKLVLKAVMKIVNWIVSDK